MFQVYYTSRNLLTRLISFEITPAKLKGGLPAPLSPTICAIEMVNLMFVINLKFSRAVEDKNILKLPRLILP